MAKSRVANPFEDTTRTSPAPGPQPGEGNAAYLVVLAGSNVGEMYKVEERTVMGRGESAHIRAPVPPMPFVQLLGFKMASVLGFDLLAG